MLPDKPEPVLFAKLLHKVACLGRIHAVQPAFSVLYVAKVLLPTFDFYIFRF
jgi:hypothetical protein